MGCKHCRKFNPTGERRERTKNEIKIYGFFRELVERRKDIYYTSAGAVPGRDQKRTPRGHPGGMIHRGRNVCVTSRSDPSFTDMSRATRGAILRAERVLETKLKTALLATASKCLADICQTSNRTMVGRKPEISRLFVYGSFLLTNRLRSPLIQ